MASADDLTDADFFDKLVDDDDEDGFSPAPAPAPVPVSVPAKAGQEQGGSPGVEELVRGVSSLGLADGDEPGPPSSVSSHPEAAAAALPHRRSAPPPEPGAPPLSLLARAPLRPVAMVATAPATRVVPHALRRREFGISPPGAVIPRRRAPPVRVAAPWGVAGGGGGGGSPVGELWLRTRGGGGGASAEPGHVGSHESELDLALLVSDFLEGGSGDSRGSSDSESELSDLAHLADKVSMYKQAGEEKENELLSMVHLLFLRQVFSVLKLSVSR